MWAFDIVCDISWLKKCKGELGDPSYKIKSYSKLLNSPIDILLFAYENALRHVRFILHTSDQNLAQQCINANICAWVNSIESGVILLTKSSFEIPKVDGEYGFMTIESYYDGGKHHALYLEELARQTNPFDVKLLGNSLAYWSPQLHTHLHYFRRMIDPSINLEFRWLNAYKLFEWHFVKRHLKSVAQKKELAGSAEWKNFLDDYKEQLSQYLKNKQEAHGLVEEVRNMVAHAFLDNRTEHERVSQPANLIQLTFPIMRNMAINLLNNLKDPNVPVALRAD
jgi:hypothetical protein